VLTEGANTNLFLQALCNRAPLVLMDFDPDNVTPAFAALGGITFSNSTTSGTATAILTLTPYFGEAGDYTVSVRAAATNGSLGTLNLAVTVLPNPAVAVTRWKDPVSGNWNDASKWSDGLPDSTRAALIALPGSYAVRLNINTTIAGLGLGGISGLQTLDHAPAATFTLNGPSVVRRNGLYVFRRGTLTGTGSFYIAGEMNWTNDTVNSVLSGAGTLTVGPSGVMQMLGRDSFTSLRRRIDNYGTVLHTGTFIEFSSGTFNNQAGGNYIATGTGLTAFITPNVINNSGTFTKTNNGIFASTVPFNNSGLVSVSAGTLSFAQFGPAQHSGTFVVSNGATLQFGGNTHSFSNTTTFTGSGTTRFQSPLSLAADLSFGTLDVVFENAADISGPFTLASSAGGSITFDKSLSIPGSLTIGGAMTNGGPNTVTVHGTFTLPEDGILNNAGAVIVGAACAIHPGATLLGNPPQCPQPFGVAEAFRILQLRLWDDELAPTLGKSARGITSQITLSWTGTPASAFSIESSADLIQWSEAPATITESAPGQCDGKLTVSLEEHRFFRIKRRPQ
jgi:hypothetical protein